MPDAVWSDEWQAALEGLELDVRRAEELLVGGHLLADAAPVPSFVPPAGLGPLPPSLADRARALLQRQIETAGGLTRAMHDTRQQLALTNRFESGRRVSPPLYVDSAC